MVTVRGHAVKEAPVYQNAPETASHFSNIVHIPQIQRRSSPVITQTSMGMKKTWSTDSTSVAPTFLVVARGPQYIANIRPAIHTETEHGSRTTTIPQVGCFRATMLHFYLPPEIERVPTIIMQPTERDFLHLIMATIIWRNNRSTGEGQTEPIWNMAKPKLTTLTIDVIDQIPGIATRSTATAIAHPTARDPIPGAGNRASHRPVLTATG
ncbi:hypothetical protein IMSHALPRED_003209 [Imshaugia aleurites]|uniref:Uncharacterized protein n=1 Tax=Imshaugia aleurites TaxID=172621 RepID=A0A8H3J7K9_9LECA|nr:hypothetical protein IMSHALPRED_003209 [Imshaugia aleurites]